MARTRNLLRWLGIGLLLSGALLCLASVAHAEEEAPASVSATPDMPWEPTLEFGGKTGTRRHLWELDLTIPVKQSERSLWFVDLRGRQDDDSSEEGNFGVAYRRLLSSGEGIVGVYGFYDLLHSRNGHSFDQATLGGEYLTRNWELRGNVYVPEGGPRSLRGSGASGAQIVGNQIAVTGASEERAMHGVDLEVGGRLPLSEQDLWLRAAFFHFNRGGFEDVTGPRLGAEWGIDLDGVARGAKLTLGGEWQEDDVRGSQAFATARIRIPLGANAWSRSGARAAAPSWSHTRMQEKIRRDVDVVVGEKIGTVGPGMNPMTGDAFSGIYFAADGAEGVGTAEDPADLDDALDLAGENGVVVVLGEEGSIYTRGITLEDGMVLVGGGSKMPVRGSDGTAFLALPGERGALDNDGDSDTLIELARGAGGILIQGLDLSDAGSGIVGYENHDVVVRDVNVENVYTGMTFRGVQGLRIEDSVVDGADYEGISVYGGRGEARAPAIGSSDVAIVDNQVLDQGDMAITVNGVENVEISGNVVEPGSDYAGIDLSYVSGSIAITDNEIDADDDDYGTGIELDLEDMDAQFDISGNTLSNFMYDGISVSAYEVGTVTGTIRNNRLTGYGDDEDSGGVGIDVHVEGGGSLTVRIEGNTIEEISMEGIRARAGYEATLDAEIVDNVLDDTFLYEYEDDEAAILVGAHGGGHFNGVLDGNEVDNAIIVENESYEEDGEVTVNGCAPQLSDLNGDADVIVYGDVRDGNGTSCDDDD